MRVVLLVLTAFTVGVGVGIFADAFTGSHTGLQCVEEDMQVCQPSAADDVAFIEGGSKECASRSCNIDAEADAPSVEPAAVEVVEDDSPAHSCEITAAHAARQARRAAAREMREKNRRDFLAELNLQLLTPRQKRVHELYVEALSVNDETEAEIRRLREAGQEVPSSLQTRLNDAQSVLRADRNAEYRAMREAAARCVGLDEAAVSELMGYLSSVDEAFDVMHDE